MRAAEQEYLAPERQPVSAVAAEIKTVMQDEQLSERRQVTTWLPRNKEKKDSSYQLADEVVQLIASIFKFTLWAVVLVLILLAIAYRKRLLALLKPLKKHTRPAAQPDVLFGMDIRPESLPENIAAHARTLWTQQQPRAALSLLYRGALMRLTRHHELPVTAAHTEGDIL
ncbi:MAG: hypothetical protein R3E89_16155 [Thiolinea sp.]